VQAVIDLADRLGSSLSEADRAAAAARFAVTARYEWMFWEMGLRRERWPV
jgi:thiaminase/transcriptional activator TenA